MGELIYIKILRLLHGIREALRECYSCYYWDIPSTRTLLVGGHGMVTDDPQVFGLHCGALTTIGKAGAGMGFAEVVVQYSWIQLTKTKINWCKLSHDPASGLRAPRLSDAEIRP